MHKSRSLKIFIAAVCVLALIDVGRLTANHHLLGSVGTEEQDIQVLTIGTADSGGTMYPVGRSIAEVINQYAPTLKINTSASSGSLTNVEGLRAGQIDMGLVSSDVAYCAYHGMEEFSGKPMVGLRAVSAVYLSTSNWMAPNTMDTVYVHDLLGKRVAVGPEESTTEISARTALEVVGIDSTNTTLVNYGLGSGSEALRAGTVDAVHGLAGFPIKGMVNLAKAVPCHLLSYTDEELSQILAGNSQYVRAVIPAGTYYGQMKDVQTFGVKCLLCVSVDMDDELVYTITKTLQESVQELAELHPAMQPMEKGSFACNNLPIPLHPGAMRYYQKFGLISAANK